MKVRLKKDYNTIVPGKKHQLTPGTNYNVIGIECDDYRILDDSDDPVLYSPHLFDITDATEPADWISTVDDGCRYAYPVDFGKVGFWEDYHDKVPEAVEVFDRYMTVFRKRPDSV